MKLKTIAFCLLVALGALVSVSSAIDFNSYMKYKRVYDAVRILLFGQSEDDDLDQNVSDLFINTKKGVLNQIDNAIDMIHVDEIFRIFFQSIVIIIAQNRYDLIPSDFEDRHPEYTRLMLKLNELLNRMADKGTTSVTIEEIKPFIKFIKSDDFVDTINDLYDSVKKNREKEAIRLKERDEKKKKEKEDKAQEL